MQTSSRFFICTLLLLTAGTLLWGQLPQFQAHASTCHSHPAPASDPLPRGHECCQAGHDSAVPQTELGNTALPLLGTFEQLPNFIVFNSSTPLQHTAFTPLRYGPLRI